MSIAEIMASNNTDTERSDPDIITRGEENLEDQRLTSDSVSQVEAEFQKQLKDCEKEDINVVIIGLTGSGKSSLVNRLCKLGGDNVAEVDDGASPCQHTEYVKEYQIQLGNITMHMFDTRGLSDPNVSAKKIFGTMKKELKEIDLLLICHRLYSKVDESTYEMGKKLKQYFGSEMFDHAIVVLTQADEYIVHCKSYREKKGRENIKVEIIARIESVKRELKAMLVDYHQLITKHHFLTIPFCVSSCYTTCKWLPTIDNWEDDLWHHMAKRCTDKAAPLLGFLARNKRNIAVVSGTSAGIGGIAVVAAGAAFGGVVGTAIPIPVAGTVIGAVVGGAVAGVIVVIGTAAVATTMRN